MNWNPNPPPVGGITVASLAEWLYRNLRDLAGVLQSVHNYEVLHTAPDKPKIGDVYYADGSDWDPGSGEGLYVYTAAGYVSGSTATIDVNAFSPLFFVDVPNQRVGILTATPSEDFEVDGNINLTGVLTVNSAAGTAGQVLTSAGAGSAPTWTDSAASDNLGDHIATQNIVLGSYYLSGDGGDEGILVNSAGGVVLSSNLDVNGYLSFTGEFTPDASPGTAGQILTSGGGGVSPTWESLVDGRDVSADGAKLDGIEAGADVTDTTNVTGAGAVMDSEVVNLAAVKAFDPTDYATAAQGALADSAVQTETDPVVGAVNGIVKANGAGTISAASAGTDYLAPTGDGSSLSGVVTTETDPVFTASQAANITAQMITDLGNLSGTNTGDQDLSSYQLKPAEGAFVDGDKTKLDGIEAGADVTNTANVTTAGAVMDSEVTNLAAVKAFDPTDYATAAQGALADSAVQTETDPVFTASQAANITAQMITDLGNLSGTNTGDQDLSSYQLKPAEGAFVDGDKTKLDGIETGATADQSAGEIETAINSVLTGTVVGTSDTQTLTNKTIDGDSNTLSNLDIGHEVDWAVATDVTDASAFASGDKVLIFEAGVGLRKIDYDDLPAGGGGGGLSDVVDDTTPQLGGNLDLNGHKLVYASTQLLYYPTTFTGSLFIGDGGGSLSHTTGSDGYYNTGLGIGALQSNTTGLLNTATGYQALSANTTAKNNTATGYQALKANTTGAGNVATGSYALLSNTTGKNNVANGYAALYSNNGNYNIANGQNALFSNTDGDFNVANGGGALLSNTTGSYNTAAGHGTLQNNTTGDSNIANGFNALFSNTTGKHNTANGASSLFSNTTGDYNTGLGYLAGRFIYDGSTPNETGTKNFFLGYYTKALADGDTNETVIGYDATGAGSNSVTIGNTSVTKTVIRGALIGNERSSDPADPAEGTYALWQSDGTGSGDDGDIMIKITAGGTTKTATLVDFSTL